MLFELNRERGGSIRFRACQWWRRRLWWPPRRWVQCRHRRGARWLRCRDKASSNLFSSLLFSSSFFFSFLTFSFNFFMSFDSLKNLCHLPLLSQGDLVFYPTRASKLPCPYIYSGSWWDLGLSRECCEDTEEKRWQIQTYLVLALQAPLIVVYILGGKKKLIMVVDRSIIRGRRLKPPSRFLSRPNIFALYHLIFKSCTGLDWFKSESDLPTQGGILPIQIFFIYKTWIWCDTWEEEISNYLEQLSLIFVKKVLSLEPTTNTLT